MPPNNGQPNNNAPNANANEAAFNAAGFNYHPGHGQGQGQGHGQGRYRHTDIANVEFEVRDDGVLSITDSRDDLNGENFVGEVSVLNLNAWK